MGKRRRSLLAGAAWVLRENGLRREVRELAQRLADMERLSAARAWQPDDLRFCERRVHSQNGEDGILEEIFRRIGTTNRFFVEFGVEDGSQCNCRLLAETGGWHGVFLEIDQQNFGRLQERYRDSDRVRCLHARVTSGEIERLLAAEAVPQDFDLLSIDIDGNDYWVWSAINAWTPRVVVIEYNAHYRPPRRWVMKEDDAFRWTGSSYYGASLTSLQLLGARKGYALVSTDSTGVNAFFVRNDLIGAGNFYSGSAAYHYSPPAFGPNGAGHRVEHEDRPYEEI